jgi:hypothetical protein
LILLVLAADKPITHKKLIEYELEGFGMRWGSIRPHVLGQLAPPAYLVRCSDEPGG